MAERSEDIESAPEVPREPIQKLIDPIKRFMHVQAAGGVVLVIATMTALILANSSIGDQYVDFWKTKVGFKFGSYEMAYKLQHWINDGLMVIFFFVVGLEVKRELVIGDLRDPKKAALPVAAALGGMLVPALLFLAVASGGKGQSGWGIPMATDIAFVVGCMAVLGSLFPHPLRVLVLTLAIVDDIGAILVIAIGYTEHINFGMLLLASGGIAFVLLLQRVGVRNIAVYVLVGLVIWFGFHESGVHATIAGVILGLLTPTKTYVPPSLFIPILDRARSVLSGDWEDKDHRADKVAAFGKLARETIPPQEYIEQRLHPWVSFVIMPVFALANAGVPIHLADLQSTVASAIILGLVAGKPLGILLFSWLSVRAGVARLPEGIRWGQILAGGALAGIGFTMALFIAGLAPFEEDILGQAKIGILAASFLSALVGIIIINLVPKSIPANSTEDR